MGEVSSSSEDEFADQIVRRSVSNLFAKEDREEMWFESKTNPMSPKVKRLSLRVFSAAERLYICKEILRERLTNQEAADRYNLKQS